jgi:hypothetical protein
VLGLIFYVQGDVGIRFDIFYVQGDVLSGVNLKGQVDKM